MVSAWVEGGKCHQDASRSITKMNVIFLLSSDMNASREAWFFSGKCSKMYNYQKFQF
jgi:hypothetical protein